MALEVILHLNYKRKEINRLTSENLYYNGISFCLLVMFLDILKKSFVSTKSKSRGSINVSMVAKRRNSSRKIRIK
jgi:hypothetical protein